MGREFLARRDPLAVVSQDQGQGFGPIFQGDLDAGGRRVPGDVGQRLLEDAEERGRQVAVERQVLLAQAQLARQPGAAGELLRLPLDRRDQPQVIQQAGPQPGSDAAHGADGVMQQGRHRVHLGGQIGPPRGQPPIQPGQVYLERG